jgi:hypothetical protein
VPQEPYDLIYSFGVIHHTPNPEAVLEQLRQYSGPGTTVKIMVYHGGRGKWRGYWLRKARAGFGNCRTWWQKIPRRRRDAR